MPIITGWGDLITYTYDKPITSQHFYCYPSSHFKTIYIEPEEE